MTQTSSKFFDEIARLMTDAAGVANGVRKEVDTVMRHQAEKILNDLDIVSREEFDAVKEMARKARQENEKLAARIAELEATANPKPKKPAPKKRASAKKPAARKPAAKQG